MEIVQQVCFERFVGAEREGLPAVRPNQPPRSLDQPMPNRRELLEFPQWRPFRGRAPLLWPGGHLQFATQVVGQHAGEEKDLIADPPAARHVVELALRLELAKDGFLSPTTLMKRDDATGSDALVGDDDLELVAIDVRHKEVELDRPAVTDGVSSPHDQEPRTTRPTLGLPRQLEVGDISVEAMPAPPALHPLLEIREAMKGHGDAELGAQFFESPNHGLAEERTVHTHLNAGPWQRRARGEDAGADEVQGAVGVVNIARAMEDIQDLACLSEGAEERIVATLAFLLRIESDGSAFGPAAGSNHRTVKVKGHSLEVELCEAVKVRWPARLYYAT